MNLKLFIVGAAYWILLLCIAFGLFFRDAVIVAYSTGTLVLFKQIMEMFFMNWMEEAVEQEEDNEDEDGEDSSKDG